LPDYLAVPIETDPDALAQEAFDRLGDLIPGWEPAEGNLDTIMLEVIARMAAETRDVASAVPTAIFRYYGASVMGIQPIDAAPASGSSTWTMIDNQGYTVPAGTAVAIAAAGDQRIAFEVAFDVVVPPGSTATAAGEVPLVARQEGIVGNGLVADPEPVDSLAFVESIALVGATGGGADAETDSAYLTRLADELRLLAPRPIVPDDFATLAKSIAGVARATAIDGYDPGPPALTDQERTVTVALVDSAGDPVASPIKDAVLALLEAKREVNFQVFVVDPSYTPIDVDFTATAYPGFDPADVQAAAIAAVESYLSPATWGAPPFGETPLWINETTVRLSEVSEVLNRVDGLHYVDTLELNGSAANVALTGPAPLARAGTVSGTVSAP
jgi:hypothetical protein